MRSNNAVDAINNQWRIKMTDMDKNDIDRLDSAWKEIEKTVSDLGAIIRRESHNLSALHRYEGYKRGLAMLAENYINRVHCDRSRPEVLPSIGSLLNHSAPSPDFIYRMVHIEPGASYRVWGSRGDAEIVDFQLLTDWWGRYKGTPPAVPTLKTIANLSFDSVGIHFDAQGNFDFILSAKPHEGQWWKIDEQVNTLLIREYFTDYASQGCPAALHFDRIDIKDSGTTVETMAEGVDKLLTFSRSVHDWTSFFPTANGLLAKVGDNRHWEPDYGTQAGASDQRYFLARLNVKPTEALVGKFTVPEDAQYWSIALYDHWFAELNYGNCQVNLNKGLAKAGKDRTIHFVISHQDPGVANWLDLDGHEQGILQTRTKGCMGTVDSPQLKLVAFSEVRKYLPENVAMVSPEERARDLAVRRNHFHRREGR